MSITETSSWDVQAALYNSTGNALTGTITIDDVFTLTSSNKIYLGAGGVIEGNSYTITYDTGSNITGMFVMGDTTCEIRNLHVIGPDSGDSMYVASNSGVFSSDNPCVGTISGCKVSNLFLGFNSAGFVYRSTGVTLSKCVSQVKGDGTWNGGAGFIKYISSGTATTINDCESAIEHISGFSTYECIVGSIQNSSILNMNRCIIRVPSNGFCYGVARGTTSCTINITKTAVIGTITVGSAFFGTWNYGGVVVNITDCYISSSTIGGNVGGVFYRTQPDGTGDIDVTLTRFYAPGTVSSTGRAIVHSADGSFGGTTNVTLDEVYVSDNTKLHDGGNISVSGSAINIASSDIDGSLPSNGNWDAAWSIGA